MATLELDRLMDRVRVAIKGIGLPKARDLPSFDQFAKEFRRIDTPAMLGQVTKAVERIDVPKAIQRIDLPKAIERIELPAAIEQRLPRRRRRRRAPMGLVGLIGITVGVVATLALFPPTRRRLRMTMNGIREQVDGLRGDQGWSRDGDRGSVAAGSAGPLMDDPMIPSQPAHYPEGLGSTAATFESSDTTGTERI